MLGDLTNRELLIVWFLPSEFAVCRRPGEARDPSPVRRRL